MKLPPVSYYIKKALKLKSGSKKPGRDFVGTITKAQIEEIAKNKMPDLNCSTIESACNIVAGQCRSMGVKVEG
jgi:large subunit ribosomal protein L11